MHHGFYLFERAHDGAAYVDLLDEDASASEMTAAATPWASGGLHFDARVVEAGAFRDIGLVRRSERGDGLAIATRAQPRALLGADDAGPHGGCHTQRQEDLARIVPHSHSLAIGQCSGRRILGVHLEHRRVITCREASEGRGYALVRRRRDERQGISRCDRAIAGTPSIAPSIAPAIVPEYVTSSATF